jgi:hypothetical protein
MALAIHWTLEVTVPQLDALQHTLQALGVQIVDNLQSIKDAVTAQGEAIVAELEQLAAQTVIDPADVQALADQIRANTAQIQDMVPDAPPPA